MIVYGFVTVCIPVSMCGFVLWICGCVRDDMHVFMYVYVLLNVHKFVYLSLCIVVHI